MLTAPDITKVKPTGGLAVKLRIFIMKFSIKMLLRICTVCFLYLTFSSQIYAEVTDDAKDESERRLYFFGHSLIVHSFPQISTPRNETTVPHWVQKFSEASKINFTANGQFGFLLQHAKLPPKSIWGFDTVGSSWNPADNLTSSQRAESFAEANFTDIIITAANFIQDQSPEVAINGNNPEKKSPVTATLEIIDWLVANEPGIDIYIYENWPDMASYGAYPIDRKAFDRYNKYVLDDFHDWWIDYCEQLQISRPSTSIKMIPVGPIIAGLVTETPLKDIEISDLYEDDAPHGRPNIYFLASLITYMKLTGKDDLGNFKPPMSIHSLIRHNMPLVVSYIQTKLDQYAQSKTCQF